MKLILFLASVVVVAYGQDGPDLEGKSLFLEFSVVLNVELPTPPPTIMPTQEDMTGTTTDSTATTTDEDMTATNTTYEDSTATYTTEDSTTTNTTEGDSTATNTTEEVSTTVDTTTAEATTVVITTEETTTAESSNTTDENSTATDATGGTDSTATNDMTTMKSSTDSMTTESSGPPLSEDDMETIREWLYSAYNGTTGFMNVTVDEFEEVVSFSTTGTVPYELEYNVTELSAAGKIDTILGDIKKIQDDLATGDGLGIPGVGVDKTETAAKNEDERATVEDSLMNDLCENICENNRKIVCVSDEGKLACKERCVLFNSETNCEEDGLFATGECKYDVDTNPYCDCGVCGVLDNFYDEWGNQCVDACFIVGICAGGIGLLLLALIITIACIATDRNRKSSELNKYQEIENRPFDAQSWGMSPDDAAVTGTEPQYTNLQNAASPSRNGSVQRSSRGSAQRSTQGSAHGSAPRSAAPSANVSRAQSKRQGRDVDPAADYDDPVHAFDNKAYQLDGVSDPAVLTILKDYENFIPTLEHIDTSANYSIKRPQMRDSLT